MKKTLLMTTLLSVATPAIAYADAETEALRKQVKQLEARLNQLEAREKARQKQEASNASANADLAPSAGKKTKAASVAPASVNERLAIVERKQEVAEESAKSLAEKTTTVEYNSRGLSLTSPDKQYQLRLRGYAQAEWRDFIGNSNTTSVNTFLIRTARPIFEAKMTDYVNGRIMLDFSNGGTRIFDAYADFHPWPESRLVNLRVGKFKSPVGLERWESEQELLFAERGQTTNLVPLRDNGAMLFGEFIPDQLEYQVALTNGSPDLIDTNTDTDNHKDIDARIFAYPFRWTGNPWISGVGLGVAGTYGEHTNSTVANGGLTTGYLTLGQSRYFAYNAATTSNGTQWRFNPEASYYKGPYSLLGEYVLNSSELRATGVNRSIKNDAWIALTTYVITGEDANFNGVKPAHNFDPVHGNWGAFELTARAGALHVDASAFPLFSSLTTSAKAAHEAAAGINWYMNESVKVNLDYAHTSFDGGAAVGDREDEDVVLALAQFRF